MAVFAVTIVKVFVVDLAALDRIYRVLSVIGLGVTLLLTSYLYQRNQPGDEDQASPGAEAPRRFWSWLLPIAVIVVAASTSACSLATNAGANALLRPGRRAVDRPRP